jgi:hypothetical protein
MKSFAELTGKQKVIELLRWISVPAAAALGGFAARYISVLVSRLIVYGWGASAESDFVDYLRLLIFYVPKEAAFVIAGAMMAPRSRLAAAINLAVAAMLMSLVVHVLGQRNVGVVNYTHFTAESAGAALGAAYIFYSEKAKGRRP